MRDGKIRKFLDSTPLFTKMTVERVCWLTWPGGVGWTTAALSLLSTSCSSSPASDSPNWWSHYDLPTDINRITDTRNKSNTIFTIKPDRGWGREPEGFCVWIRIDRWTMLLFINEIRYISFINRMYYYIYWSKIQFTMTRRLIRKKWSTSIWSVEI